MTDLTFVKNVMDGLTAKQIAVKHNTSREAVYAKASNLRNKGVNLPHLTRAAQGEYTVEELNKYINSRS